MPLEGVASARPSWMPHGPSGVKNPHDQDYGKLLDAFYVKGMAFPTTKSAVGPEVSGFLVSAKATWVAGVTTF